MKTRHFIREWRKHRGLTMQELADQTGFSLITLSRLERGEQRYNQDALERLSAALRCGVADLLTRDPQGDTLWSIWDELEPAEREQAAAIIKALRDARRQ